MRCWMLDMAREGKDGQRTIGQRLGAAASRCERKRGKRRTLALPSTTERLCAILGKLHFCLDLGGMAKCFSWRPPGPAESTMSVGCHFQEALGSILRRVPCLCLTEEKNGEAGHQAPFPENGDEGAKPH
ncbi:hypothetical protein Nepgr_007719 [Nepenthes gracilis]|uniref:Uncharacterized protein n=1 Tax=Nepenthes gracilis TaxID=150966 RepID=A0AAD3XIL1_NEPGR|nr:hypothetical protein Nepgr_007719 [Nepenthes gracilis]